MHAARPPMTDDEVAWCCDEFRSAVDVTFVMPVNGPTGWLLYGTDAETVGAGLPELCYWTVRYCPFCGARLRPYPDDLPRGRAFGFDEEMTDNRRHHETGHETGEKQGPGNL